MSLHGNQQRHTSEAIKWGCLLAGGLGLIACLGLSGIIANKPAPRAPPAPVQPPPRPAPSASPACALASLDAGERLPEDDLAVRQYADMLQNLRVKFPASSEQKIADSTVASQRLLKDRCGEDLKLMEIMAGANRATAGSGDTGTTYERFMAWMISLHTAEEPARGRTSP